MAQHRPPYSPNTLRLSELFQKTTGHIGRAATWLVAGSSSPAYLQLNWRTVPNEVIDSEKFIKMPGNSRAGLFMRQWKTAYLLSMDSLELEMINQKYPDAQPAIALNNNGFTQLGTHKDLYFGKIADGDRRAIAGREGRGPVEVSAGLYSAADGHLIVPTTLKEQALQVPLSLFEIAAMQTVRVV